MKNILFIFIVFLCTPLVVFGHSFQNQTMDVGHPWVRPVEKSGAADVYFTVLNKGDVQDVLVGAATPVAPIVSLHDGHDFVHEIYLLPGKPLVFKPGGMHVRLIGLREDLKEGDRFPLTLQFRRSGGVMVEVWVESVKTLF